MLPRNSADYRTLLWVLVPPVLIALQLARPEWVPYLSPLSFYFALACGIIAHNHNHCPTFRGKRANHLFGTWISVFYGYPTFAWIPTHNLNHHRYVNADGDATITWRHTNRHNVVVAATYFFVSSYYQSGPINDYIKQARAKNPELFRRIMSQYVVWIGSYLAVFGLGVWLHGFSTGLYVFGFAMGLPALFSLWTIMLFNYDQHVHADPFSKYDHSRSFTSPTLNFLLFNNGYHAAHHERPGAHWSELAELHAQLAPHINPVLNQKSLWWYWFKQYALTPFFPKLGTVQLGAGPDKPPPQRARDFEAQANAPEGLEVTA
ncbi:MAG TPA: fatty acid desaturase [Polyangiales bacterium]